MKFLLFCIIFSAKFIFSSQHINPFVENTPSQDSITLQVAPFSRIFASIAKIELDPTLSSNLVIVRNGKDIMKALSITTYNNALYISPKNNVNITAPDDLIITVGINGCFNLCLAGNAFYSFINDFQADSLGLELTHQAECQMNCNVKQLELKLSADSRLMCTGSAQCYEIFMFGNSLMDVSRLQGELTRSVFQKNSKARLTNLHLKNGRLLLQ